MLKHRDRTKAVFFVLFILLAVLMCGGSHFLGQKVPSTRKLEFWRTGMPSQFDYLASKEIEIVADFPTPMRGSGESAQSLIVLLYHGIREEAADGIVSWENFKNQMFALKAAGYQTVGLSDLEEFLLRGRLLPKKSFLLTFDDGRKDSYYPVDPILEALDYRAVIFIITSMISEENDFYLTEKELKEMAASGRWELESHGHDIHKSEAVNTAGEKGHSLSNRLFRPEEGRPETDTEYEQRITLDLLESKRQLEGRFGVTVRAFAYPYGDYGQGSVNHADSAVAAIQKAASALFHMAFYQSWDGALVRNYPGLDTFMVRRLEVEPEWDATRLLNSVLGGEDKPADFSTAMQSDPGWIDGWGDVSVASGRLNLAAAKDTTGASSYLDGTYLWTDFDLTLRARLLRGESFSILARVDRRKNFVFCSFGQNGVAYGEQVDGNFIEGPGWYTDLSLLQGLEIQAGISVQGNTVRCLLNGIWGVESAFLRHKAENGMIGVSVWGPVRGESALEVISLDARKIH
ncbi:MAG: polysaccharide deacetylase family protein [Anaerolineales bacterium]|nr:polysaccharide deacetylase family protein [Anaerolineales bacterium]